MKKILIIIAIALLPIGAIGQSIFDTYEDHADVQFMEVGPKMFQMLGKLSVDAAATDAKAFIDMVNSITSLKVITTESSSITSELKSWTKTYVATKSLENLIKKSDGNKVITFYIAPGKDDNHVNELLMLVTGEETVLLSLDGDIDLNQIAHLTDKMELPGGDQLKKAGE